MFFKKTIISCMLGMTILSTSLPVNIEKPDTEYTKQYEVKVTKIVIKVKQILTCFVLLFLPKYVKLHRSCIQWTPWGQYCLNYINKTVNFDITFGNKIKYY